MKKIRLNVADLDATEVLSRDQLRGIFGGSGSLTGDEPTCTNNTCSSGGLPCCDGAYNWCVNGYCTARPIS